MTADAWHNSQNVTWDTGMPYQSVRFKSQPSFSFRPPAETHPGGQQVMGQLAVSLPHTWETRKGFLVTSAWLSNNCCKHLGSEPGDGNLSLSPSQKKQAFEMPPREVKCPSCPEVPLLQLSLSLGSLGEAGLSHRGVKFGRQGSSGV